MPDIHVETNPSDDKLREYMVPYHELYALERRFAGEMLLLTVTRYTARIEVCAPDATKVITFRLMKFDGDFRKFVTDIPVSSIRKEREFSTLIHHKAAEAMLALRKGHVKYRRDRKARKLKDAA